MLTVPAVTINRGRLLATVLLRAGLRMLLLLMELLLPRSNLSRWTAADAIVVAVTVPRIGIAAGETVAADATQIVGVSGFLITSSRRQLLLLGMLLVVEVKLAAVVLGRGRRR